MDDTSKMARPWFPRREGGPIGRVEHDVRGNAVWVRTRATDRPDLLQAELTIVDGCASATRGRTKAAQVSYYESASQTSDEPRRRPKDLRALSRWIESRKLAAQDPED